MESSEYRISVTRRLTAEEKKDLQRKHWPHVRSLSKRYITTIDIERGIPIRPEFPDAIRASWLLDKRHDRPPYSDVISAAGYSYGLLLEHGLGMEWCIIEDNYGECLSLVHQDESKENEYAIVSVPPFNYTAKREEVQNVEVFKDGYVKTKEMIGY